MVTEALAISRTFPFSNAVQAGFPPSDFSAVTNSKPEEEIMSI